MNSSDLSSPSRILELFSPAAEGNKEPKTLSQLVRLIRGFGVPADGVFRKGSSVFLLGPQLMKKSPLL